MLKLLSKEYSLFVWISLDILIYCINFMILDICVLDFYVYTEWDDCCSFVSNIKFIFKFKYVNNWLHKCRIQGRPNNLRKGSNLSQ